MNIDARARALFVACALSCWVGCNPEPAANSGGTANAPRADNPPPPLTATKITAPLPDGGFRAEIGLSNPPVSLRAGQAAVIEVHVRNAGNVTWPAFGEDDGRYAITLRDRWLAPDGQKVINDLDGGTSLPRDVRPGEQAVMSLKITAPKTPGDYLLEADMVQEQVNFFHDRGSQPARIKVRVE